MKEKIVVIQDTREKTPLDLACYGLTVEVDTLMYGDYTLRNPNLMRDLIIERKSLADFVACCGRDRERFEKEVVALRGYRNAYLVGEFGLRDILGQNYRSQINPNAVLSSIARWQTYGIHFLFCDTHEGASYITAKLLQFHAEYWTDLARSIVEKDTVVKKAVDVFEGKIISAVKL
jgi:DNA excision repair protein ERCC-4